MSLYWFFFSIIIWCVIFYSVKVAGFWSVQNNSSAHKNTGLKGNSAKKQVITAIENYTAHILNKFYVIFSARMGREKHYSWDQRALIKRLISEGKTYKEMQNIVGCSPTMVRNAVKLPARVETRGRPLVMSKKLVDRVVRYAKLNPFSSSNKIRNELSIDASVQTIRRRLPKNNLAARSPRKVALS